TLMANMPALEEACAGIAERGLHGAVGLHFNLTYGEPLTDGLRQHRLFCRDGQFDLNLPPWVCAWIPPPGNWWRPSCRRNGIAAFAMVSCPATSTPISICTTACRTAAWWLSLPGKTG